MNNELKPIIKINLIAVNNFLRKFGFIIYVGYATKDIQGWNKQVPIYIGVTKNIYD